VPRAEGLKLQGWIRRLFGGPLAVEPEVIHNIQPVILVADHRRIVSHVRSRDGIAGCTGSFPAATFNFQLRCLSPGGLVIHWMTIGNESATNPGFIRFGVQDPDATPFDEPPAGAAAVQSLNPLLPVRSRPGTLIGAPTTPPPNIAIGVGGTGGNPGGGPLVPLDLFIPPARALIIQTYVVSQSIHLAMSFTEYDDEPLQL